MIQVEVARVAKNGSSLCLNLRKQVLQWLGVRHGDVVTLKEFDGGVLVARLSPDRLAGEIEKARPAKEKP